jgi:hypothetical protein
MAGVGKLSNTGFLFAGAGTLLIAAAQTKPEDAASNIAGWLRVLGIDQAPMLFSSQSADAWATLLGGVLIVLAIVLFALRKRRKRPFDAKSLASRPSAQSVARATPTTRQPTAMDRVLEEYEPLSRWALANARAREAGAINRRTPDRDTHIKEALWYAITGDWDAGAGSMLFGNAHRLDAVIDRFREAAIDGELRVWGMRQDDGLYQLIEPSFWESNTVDRAALFAFMGAGASTQALNGDETGEEFSGIMVNRAEVEGVWPHAS